MGQKHKKRKHSVDDTQQQKRMNKCSFFCMNEITNADLTDNFFFFCLGWWKFWVDENFTIHFTLGKNLKNSRARAVFKCVFLPRRETSRKLKNFFFAWDGENFDQKNFTIHFTLGKKWKNSRAPTVFKSDFSQGARVVLRFYSIYRGQPRLFFFIFRGPKKSMLIWI